MKLTALIPAHNDDYTLGLCLTSIGPHFDEIIVLDDCSDDHTPDVVLDARAEHPHVQFIRHEGAQLGWIESRNRLLAATDSDHLFFLDADDVLCEWAAPMLRQMAESDAPAVRFQLAEMWGDFDHTTQRLKHYDRCHVYCNRRALKEFIWHGGSAAKPGVAAHVGHSPGLLFWHIKGVKPDRRLAERRVLRTWMRGGRKGRSADLLRDMDAARIHRSAMYLLLHARQDRIRRWTGRPRRPDVIEEAEPRFEMLYKGTEIVDRADYQQGSRSVPLRSKESRP